MRDLSVHCNWKGIRFSIYFTVSYFQHSLGYAWWVYILYRVKKFFPPEAAFALFSLKKKITWFFKYVKIMRAGRVELRWKTESSVNTVLVSIPKASAPSAFLWTFHTYLLLIYFSMYVWRPGVLFLLEFLRTVSLCLVSDIIVLLWWSFPS